MANRLDVVSTVDVLEGTCIFRDTEGVGNKETTEKDESVNPLLCAPSLVVNITTCLRKMMTAFTWLRNSSHC